MLQDEPVSAAALGVTTAGSARTVGISSGSGRAVAGLMIFRQSSPLGSPLGNRLRAFLAPAAADICQATLPYAACKLRATSAVQHDLISTSRSVMEDVRKYSGSACAAHADHLPWEDA